ncbi:hypothetical protein NOI44_23185, partial [Escherichia coli]
MDARPVGAIVVRLQAFPGQQFSVGDQEIQLQPPLVGVLHPQNAVLVFIEPGQREQIMASFERVLMPGLDKDQYSILWVEHTDKGRL